MTTFQNTREQIEQRVFVQLLSQIELNPSATQRTLSAELGIALGLMNGYLKRCATKGWIRATQVSPKRIKYFLTPEGFVEKSRMVKDYLAGSLSFFRDARSQCEVIFLRCVQQKWKNIALVGAGDLADIAKLVSHGMDITPKLVSVDDDLKDFDAVLITDIQDPQGAYEKLKTKIDSEKILLLELLHISRSQVGQ